MSAVRRVFDMTLFDMTLFSKFSRATLSWYALLLMALFMLMCAQCKHALAVQISIKMDGIVPQVDLTDDNFASMLTDLFDI